MKQIEELLKEYSIRFNVTDKIKRKDYPFEWKESINKGIFTQHIEIFPNGSVMVHTKNGVVCENDIWAVADVKKKPEKWVVQRSFGHPLWAEFCNWLEMKSGRNITGHYRYYNHLGKSYNKLTFFPGHQYLTLEQWKELILEERVVDFSILNNKDWFYLELERHNGFYLLRGDVMGMLMGKCHCEMYVSDSNKYNEKDGWSGWNRVEDNSIKVLRKATPKDLAPMFEKHPELAPPKEGDWGVFWNVEYKTPDKIMRLEKIERVHPFNNCVKQFFSADGLIYDNFAKVNLNNPLLPQLDELKKKIK